MSITRNRELSQFGSFLYINDSTQSIGITTDSSHYVGIGTTIPKVKLDVLGDVNVSGFVTIFGSLEASNFIGTVSNSQSSNYSVISGLSTLTSGITSTSNLTTTGIITASAFYIGDTLIINPELQTWTIGTGSSIYRLLGNVGIGISLPSEKLSVNGNVSASRFISTTTTSSPFSVSSSTLVTNLNSDFLRGKIPPSGDIVGTTDTQTLTSKTLSSPSLTSPTIGNAGAIFNGTSGSTTLRASSSASGSLTLPPETGTLVSTASNGVVTTNMILDGTITNSDISNTASISIAKLASSTISGVSLGNNLNSLNFGNFLNSSGSYNGSTSVTVSVAATTANQANTLIARNESGDFTAGTIDCAYLNAIYRITAANVSSTSDSNLKENIKTIDNSLKTINSLRGVSFDWKIDGTSSYGVIAQELESILPELVIEGKNKSVNYNGLVGVLIEAIKELSSEVEELKKKINS